MNLTAGVDEVGRGPLAGPVYAAAVILDPNKPIEGLTDSKKLSERRRIELAQTIRQTALAWAIGTASREEISRLNIFYASLLAMQRAVASLAIQPTEALIDGKFCPRLPCKAHAIVKGDLTVAVISAASIIAKVARDQFMLELDQLYPGYGFAQHKGYATQQHLCAIKELGPCPEHRLEFLDNGAGQLDLLV